MEINLLTEKELDAFFEYLDKQLRENGVGSMPVFQPVSSEESKLSLAMQNRFRHGIELEMNEPGWRRLFVVTKENKVQGHIDIRPHPDKHTEHRALLGMGVDASLRGKGMGKRLIVSLIQWMASNTSIEYLDLWVLSDNHPARALYEKCGFVKCGEIEDMYRIDGRALSYTMMTRQLISQ